MTDGDVALAVRTLQEALNANLPGGTSTWQNADSGNSGVITAGRTFVTDQGVFCRDYEERLVVGGVEGVTNHTACRDDGGVWRWVG